MMNLKNNCMTEIKENICYDCKKPMEEYEVGKFRALWNCGRGLESHDHDICFDCSLVRMGLELNGYFSMSNDFYP